MDDMAKLNVGAPAVSRYHNIRRLFATSDAPNYKDHDFPVSNYLLSVSGYMILEDRTFDNTSTASTVVNDVECNTSDNTYDRSLEVNNNSGGKIEDTYGVTVKTNENSNFWNDIMYQCLHQMDVKTNKNELRETVVKEIVENKEFYYTKFKVDENNLLEFCNFLESKLTSILYLDIVSSVLCSIFDCKVIQKTE